MDWLSSSGDPLPRGRGRAHVVLAPGYVAASRFKIRQRLGAGGMGVVYRAFDRERDAWVALKTLRIPDAQSLYRLKKEFRALQDLEHPNLVRLGELIESDGAWFYTMELVDGVQLLAFVHGTTPERRPERPSAADTRPVISVFGRTDEAVACFDELRIRESFRQLAQGIAALHATGKIHRDIKPSNVLVERSTERVVLLDFGLVQADVVGIGRHSDEGVTVGTPAYMSPEQGAGQRGTPAADWYSFGAVLYEALTGRVPFDGSALQIITDKQTNVPLAPSSLVGFVPDELDSLCMDLLSRDPANRPGYEQILDRLGTAADRPAELYSIPSVIQAPLVGRDAELRLLGDLEASVRRDQTGRVGIVYGASGLGKTALLRRYMAEVSERLPDAAVLAGRCFEREVVPYKALDGLVDSLSHYLRKLSHADVECLLPREPSLLARIFPVLGRVRAIANATDRRQREPSHLRRRCVAAVRELLEQIALQRPLVLVIDDFQWADSDSLRALVEILAPPTPPLLLVLATRGERKDERAAVEQFRAKSPVDPMLIRLGRLGPSAGIALATELMASAGIATHGAAELAREAEYHPLHIHELVRHLAAGGQHDGGLRLQDAIRARVARMAEPARTALEVLAVATAPIPEKVLRWSVALDPRDWSRVFASLRVAQLVRTDNRGGNVEVEIGHDRIRESVLSPLDATSIRKLHDRIAHALEAFGGTPELLVRHTEAAGRVDRAATYAVEAADAALASMAFARAAQLYRAALRMGTWDDETRLRIQVAQAESLANAGYGKAAAGAYFATAACADDTTALRLRCRGAEELLTSGQIDRGLDALRSLLSDIGVSFPETPRRALSSMLWSRAKLRMRGLQWTARAESEVPSEQLIELDAFRAVSHGLALVDPIRGADFNARYLSLALRAGERTRLARALGTEACMLASQGGWSQRRAMRLLGELQRLAAEDPGDAYTRGWALGATGITEYFAGRFIEAVSVLDRAVREFLSQAVGAAWELQTCRMIRMFALRHMGLFSELQEAHDEMVGDAVARGDRYLETAVRRCCAILWLGQDEPEGARDSLDATSWESDGAAFHVQHWFQLEAEAELALYSGDPSQALVLLRPEFTAMERSMLLRVQIVRNKSRWLRARLLVASGSRADTRAATRIARKMQSEGVDYAAAWGALVLAGAAASRRDLDEADRQLHAAVEHADRADLFLISATARHRLGLLIGGAKGEQLFQRSERFLRSTGVANVDRMLDMIAPGFDDVTVPTDQ